MPTGVMPCAPAPKAHSGETPPFGIFVKTPAMGLSATIFKAFAWREALCLAYSFEWHPRQASGPVNCPYVCQENANRMMNARGIASGLLRGFQAADDFVLRFRIL